jgi:hypothetical protein
MAVVTIGRMRLTLASTASNGGAAASNLSGEVPVAANDPSYRMTI